MLRSIDYEVTFGSTGRHMQEMIVFQTGFGTITGPNEAGKSFVIEMVRWALFGSSALRGKQSEMKKARAKLVFSVRGDDYVIERTTSNAKLSRDGQNLAIGTQPVNQKVAQVLGFGMDVFDIACVANQGDLERLGAMKPAERKRMVDNVIGLGIIDDLAKYTAEEAKNLRRQAEDLLSLLRSPVAPDRPHGYRPAAELETELAAKSDARAALARIEGRLSHGLRAPDKPNTAGLDRGGLLEHSEKLRALKAEEAQLVMELRSLPAPSKFTTDQLDQMERDWVQYRAHAARQELVNQLPRTFYLADQLDSFAVGFESNARRAKISHLEKQVADLLAHGTNCCPACNHEWAVQQTAIDALKLRLAEFGDKPEAVEIPIREDQLPHFRKVLESMAEIGAKLINTPEVGAVDKPALSAIDIEDHRNRNRSTQRTKELQEAIAELGAKLKGYPHNYDRLLLELDAYEKALAQFTEWEVERGQLEHDAVALRKQIEGLDDLVTLHRAVQLYDARMKDFESELETYTKAMTTVDEQRSEAKDWDKASEALRTLRSMVKQHLVPSLNRVASYYLQQMTGGQRQSIFVDEEFDILVDGQALNTLSGSGKAVANLALRIGLGQVLTNNVFSLFVGDEIDASMDKDRAENTAQTLGSLRQRISQIILITHKSPPADYYINVGRRNAEQIPLAG